MKVNKSDNTGSTAKPELQRQANDVNRTWNKIPTFFQAKRVDQPTGRVFSFTHGSIGKLTGEVTKIAKKIMNHCQKNKNS
ncbi:MAG: hypothetical protein EB051_04815 [Chlamydiia bacterium]|nr:hypothetical protein [Chlamydiia bacterium]